MGSLLLLVMNVHSLFVDPAMNMKEERAINLALSAKPDTSILRGAPEWMGMKMKMSLIIWTGLITMVEILKRLVMDISLLAIILAALFLGSLLHQNWILLVLIQRSHFLLMVKRMTQFQLISML